MLTPPTLDMTMAFAVKQRMVQQSPTLSGVVFIIFNKPSQAKVSNFDNVVFSHQDVTGCQVTVNQLLHLNKRHSLSYLHAPTNITYPTGDLTTSHILLTLHQHQ